MLPVHHAHAEHIDLGGIIRQHPPPMESKDEESGTVVRKPDWFLLHLLRKAVLIDLTHGGSTPDLTALGIRMLPVMESMNEETLHSALEHRSLTEFAELVEPWQRYGVPRLASEPSQLSLLVTSTFIGEDSDGFRFRFPFESDDHLRRFSSPDDERRLAAQMAVRMADSDMLPPGFDEARDGTYFVRVLSDITPESLRYHPSSAFMAAWCLVLRTALATVPPSEARSISPGAWKKVFLALWKRHLPKEEKEYPDEFLMERIRLEAQASDTRKEGSS